MSYQSLSHLFESAAVSGTLDLRGQQLTTLPLEIWALSNLKSLYLDHNQLTTLPPQIVQLTQLRLLSLSYNNFTDLPAALSGLQNLQWLSVANNQLSTLPAVISELKNLKVLSLSNNQLKALPQTLTGLSQLQVLSLKNNPLVYPPPEILSQGVSAGLTYLEKSVHGRRQWLGKVVVVGESGVGKTALLRALRGEPLKPVANASSGIEVNSWLVQHPFETKITLQLNTWDFSGPIIHHAIHQLFLSNRSLFILVWNARLGHETGKVSNWLSLIQARAPESPILLVATHVDGGFEPVLPWRELQQKYSQLVSYHQVSNDSRFGIETLQHAIKETVAKLPLMGEIWPNHWIAAAQSIRLLKSPFVTPSQLQAVMMDKNLTLQEGRILSKWLHELGELLYYQDDHSLNRLVILKPQWITEYLNRVLTSALVVANKGILSHTHLRELWHDLEPPLREHSLNLMEHFDLSYRTLDRYTGLVVECLPLDSPEHLKSWQKMSNAKEIRMTYQFQILPAGIPSGFIARTRRFSTNTQWRYGALLAHRHHFGLIQASILDNKIELAVRGPYPHNFFTLLREVLESTLQRYPGLPVQRKIPCGGHQGQPCHYEFDYAVLEKAMSKGVSKIQCQETFEALLVESLLFGLDWRTQVAILQQIEKWDAVPGKAIQEQRRNLVELSQRLLFQLLPPAFAVPYFFTLDTVEEITEWQQLFSLPTVKLQLYCQGVGLESPHPVSGGGYTISEVSQWAPVSPLVNLIVNLLATYRLGQMSSTKSVKIEKSTWLKQLRQELLQEAVINDETKWCSLEILLKELDPGARWGGLKPVVTPEGQKLWLCPHHVQEWERRN